MGDFDITRFGAVGDGSFDNTEAIAAAISACAEAGGGTVRIPAGEYLTGPVHLVSHLVVELEAGAVLKFKQSFDAYPAVWTRWSGYECYGFSPLIYGRGLSHVSIRGEGIIDGQGEPWWTMNRRLRRGEMMETERTRELHQLNEELYARVNSNIVEWPSGFFRPPLIQLLDCEHVGISGVTLRNSPFWNTHLVYCTDVHLHNVSFQNPPDAPNGDGLDIDSCRNVRISDCTFDVGDDCLCIKSGIDEDGRRVGRPSENITIANCTMMHGHGGVVFGSEMSGGIRNVTVTGCIFIGTDRGIRMKTNRARGGYIRNIQISNIYMEGVLCPLAINGFYRHGVDESDPRMTSPEAVPITEGTPVIEGIRVSDVTARGCLAAAGFIYGLPERPVRDVRLHHVTVEMTADPDAPGGEPDMVRDAVVMAGEGMLCRHVEDMELHHVRIETRQGPALRLEDVRDALVNGLGMKARHPGTPPVAAGGCRDIRVNGLRLVVEPDEGYAAWETWE